MPFLSKSKVNILKNTKRSSQMKTPKTIIPKHLFVTKSN